MSLWALTSAFFEADFWEWEMAGAQAMDGDLPVPDWGLGEGLGTGGSDTFYRLREGIERFLITDINNPAASAMGQSEIYVAWDLVATVAASFNHIPGGSNVLYLDGHVSFVRYPSSGPVNEGQAIISGGLIEPPSG